MNIKEFIEKNKIEFTGSWVDYDEKFRNATKSLKDAAEIHAYVKANKPTLEKYRSADNAGWTKLMSDLWDQVFGVWPDGHSDSPWATPTAAHEAFVMNLLKKGLLVENAQEALYNIFGYQSLFEDIAAASVEMPKSNFADVLTNFIVKMEPKNVAIKNMQTAIMQDEDLASLIVPPSAAGDNIKESIKNAVRSLHEDFRLLSVEGRLTQQNAKIKMFIRARRLGITTESIEASYMRMYKDSGLIGDKNVLRAIKVLKNRLVESVSETDKVTTLYEVAIKNNIKPSILEETYKKLYETKIKRVKSSVNWKKAYYTESFQDEEFETSSLAKKVDLVRKILPGKKELKFNELLEKEYGQDFAYRFSSLMHIAEIHNMSPLSGQNEKEIDAYLRKHANADHIFIAALEANIDSILRMAKTSVMENIMEYEEPRKVFGRKKPEITIRKDPNAPEDKEEFKPEPYGWLGSMQDIASQYDFDPSKKDAIVCPNCEGSGEISGKLDPRCPACHGKGFFTELWIREAVKKVAETKGKHWFDSVQEVAGENSHVHNLIVSRMVASGIIEATVLAFDKSTHNLKNKPSHVSYLVAWAQKLIEKEIKLNHVKNEIDANDLEMDILDRLYGDLKLETGDECEEAAEKFQAEFEKKFGSTVYNYIIKHMTVKEDVVNFPGNKSPKITKNFSNNVVDIGGKKKINSMLTLVSFIKDMIEKNDMSSLAAFNELVDIRDAILKQIGASKDDFDRAFKELSGDSFILYYMDKAQSDRNAKGEVTESKNLSNLFLLVEGKSPDTAHKMRVHLAKKIREMVDSSDISLLSNFESYEEMPHISLKISVYQDNATKLSQILDSVKSYVKECGYEGKDGKFVKDDLIIRFTPVRKTFRSGPYKNRETPSFGVEVIGPKKAIPLAD